MKLKTLAYRRTINLGNFESHTLEVGADLEEGDDPIEATNQLKDFVTQRMKTLGSTVKPTMQEATDALRRGRPRVPSFEIKDDPARFPSFNIPPVEPAAPKAPEEAETSGQPW